MGEMRKVDEVKELEDQLNKFGSVLTDQDLAETLQPLFAKDPEAVEFLEKELAWDFGGAGKGGGAGEQLKFYPQKAFYLNTIMGGMGFGPQFRSADPTPMWPARCHQRQPVARDRGLADGVGLP